MIVVTIPGLRLVSEANAREHWARKAARVKRQRTIVKLVLGPNGDRVAVPAVVTITRIAPRALDSDNATGSAKAVRDQIAWWLGVDDRSPLVEWRVTQERGAPRTYAVRIRVEAVPQ